MDVERVLEYENSIFSLAKALEKTQKLLNALENVIIPQYKENINTVSIFNRVAEESIVVDNSSRSKKIYSSRYIISFKH